MEKNLRSIKLYIFYDNLKKLNKIINKEQMVFMIKFLFKEKHKTQIYKYKSKLQIYYLIN